MHFVKKEDVIRAMQDLYNEDMLQYGVEIPETFDKNRAIAALVGVPEYAQYISKYYAQGLLCLFCNTMHAEVFDCPCEYHERLGNG